MTLPEFPERSLDPDDTATERRLRRTRLRPPRFSAEAIFAALPPAELGTARRPNPVQRPRQTGTTGRQLVLAVAAAWLGGMISGAAAIHSLQRDLSRGEAVEVAISRNDELAPVVAQAPDPSGGSESVPSLPERRRNNPPATEVAASPDRWHASLRDRYGASASDQILRDYGLRAGSLLRVRPRLGQRPMPSETAAVNEPSWLPRPSHHFKPREPLTPASYRQWPAAAFDQAGSGLF